jgi:hypothetical protein
MDTDGSGYGELILVSIVQFFTQNWSNAYNHSISSISKSFYTAMSLSSTANTWQRTVLITDTIRWMEMGVWLKRSVLLLCTKIGWLKPGIRGGTNNKGFHRQLHSPTECCACMLFHDNYKQCHDFEIALLILTFNIIIIHLSLGFSSFVCFVQLAVSVAWTHNGLTP